MLVVKVLIYQEVLEKPMVVGMAAAVFMPKVSKQEMLLLKIVMVPVVEQQI